MKTVWVLLIAVLAFVAGLIGGSLLGTAGGALGGALAGVCYTARIAVSEGLINDEQRQRLLQGLATKYSDAAQALQVSGDLNTACKDLLARSP
jgi:uncharacterized oligopeptide transporter (OPT) family protein